MGISNPWGYPLQFSTKNYPVLGFPIYGHSPSSESITFGLEICWKSTGISHGNFMGDFWGFKPQRWKKHPSRPGASFFPVGSTWTRWMEGFLFHEIVARYSSRITYKMEHEAPFRTLHPHQAATNSSNTPPCRNPTFPSVWNGHNITSPAKKNPKIRFSNDPSAWPGQQYLGGRIPSSKHSYGNGSLLMIGFDTMMIFDN